MEIFLIRHTTPAIAAGVCYGQTDLELAETFVQEKERVLAQLPLPLDAVYSSPLKRCRQLAEAIPSSVLRIDERLLELHFGRWEMSTWESIPAGELNPWMQDYIHTAPPAGETALQMQERVLAWWEQLLLEPYQRVAVVSHAGVIRLLMAALAQKPITDAFHLSIGYGEVLKIHKPT